MTKTRYNAKIQRAKGLLELAAGMYETSLSFQTTRAAEQAYREGLRDLSQLRRSIGAEDPELARDVQGFIREMEGLNPSRFPGNPELIERVRAQFLPALEQMELQLRRKLNDGQGEGVRATGSEKTPDGYAEAVAEYFRRLSRSR